MYAIVQRDGHQYRVQPGQTIAVERIEAMPGSEVREQLADRAELVRARRLNAFEDQIGELRGAFTLSRPIAQETP